MEMDIGLIGLAVMGQNLALNLAEKGWKVSVFNRTQSKVDDFLSGPARGFSIAGFHSISDFVKSVKSPKSVIVMVKAGEAVDATIQQLLPFLSEGDSIIDGGNSFYVDTQRREQFLQEKGIRFLGVGISGGEEGARHGPSIMPGGNFDGWNHVQNMLQSIAAKVDGEVCCSYVGPGGSGHYVKMIHNGIEYADMQLIAETYHMMKAGLHMGGEEIANTFFEWNKGQLKSYLIEITAKILAKKDKDGAFLIDQIKDVAAQKGTGRWTVESGLEYGVPVSVIAEAVFARFLSTKEDLRKQAQGAFSTVEVKRNIDRQHFLKTLQDALYVAKIFCYAQGFALLKEASTIHNWGMDLGKVALLWRGGCIIRSAFLGEIKHVYDRDPLCQLLLLDPFFQSIVEKNVPALREVVQAGVLCGIPLPCACAALSWYDSIRQQRLPTQLIQAQRDFFGAHTYERYDAPSGRMFHTEWDV